MIERRVFKKSYKGIGEMLVAPWLVPPLIGFAEEMKGRAIGFSPVGKSGASQTKLKYVESFDIQPGIQANEKGTRAYARLVNLSPHAVYVEFGNSRTPEYAPMRKAMGIPVTGHNTRPPRHSE